MNKLCFFELCKLRFPVTNGLGKSANNIYINNMIVNLKRDFYHGTSTRLLSVSASEFPNIQ